MLEPEKTFTSEAERQAELTRLNARLEASFAKPDGCRDEESDLEGMIAAASVARIIPAEPREFTAFCQDASGRGTIWIGAVQAVDVESAKVTAVAECAADWSCDPASVHCLGLAAGDVQILHWADLGDD